MRLNLIFEGNNVGRGSVAAVDDRQGCLLYTSIARYEHQYQRRNHHHMVCTECGSSVEFFSAEIERIEQEVGRKNKYLPTRHTFQIYGICDKCRKKQKRG